VKASDAGGADAGAGARNLVQDLWKFTTASLTQEFTQTADS